MSFEFNSELVTSGPSKVYLNEAGVHLEGKLIALTYQANENWEGFDIEVETKNGAYFRERTFGPNIDKVYPKMKWEDGKEVGMESNQEAFDRVQKEISQKLFHLGMCFLPQKDLIEGVGTCETLKELVEKLASLIEGQRETLKKESKDLPAINFLTMWKNSPSKKKSTLIFASKVKWCEATRFGSDGEALPAKITFTKYQRENYMVEKYPYQGNNDSTNSVEGGVAAGATTSGENGSDLPF